MEELVSLIIPVYNAKDTLARCVRSVTDQSYASLQIILVDDGSSDGSGALCDTLAERDTRIEVLHQPNGGVSAARNTGLRALRGAWLCFVDADDFVSPHYVEQLRRAARDDCDIVISAGLWAPNSVEPHDVDYCLTTQTEYIPGREASLRRFGSHVLYNSIWGKLFRATLWQGVSFPVGRLAEDLFVSHTLLYHARQVAVTNAALYVYVQSEHSIMRSRFSLSRLDALDAWEEGVRVFTRAGETGLAQVALRVYASRVFDALCICRREIPEEREALRQLRLRAYEAYRRVRPVRRYVDCSAGKALAYRLMFLTGRHCLPLYDRLWVRGRWRDTI